MPKWWYLQPFDNTSNSTNLSEPELSGLLHLLIALILYGYLIPRPLYNNSFLEIVIFEGIG